MSVLLSLEIVEDNNELDVNLSVQEGLDTQEILSLLMGVVAEVDPASQQPMELDLSADQEKDLKDYLDQLEAIREAEGNQIH